MSKMRTLLVLVLVGASWQSAYGQGQVIVTLSGTATAGMDLQLKAFQQPEGTGWAFGSPVSISSGDGARTTRNKLVPPMGAASQAGTVRRITISGQPGFHFNSSSDITVHLDIGGNTFYVEPGFPLDLNGITFSACIPEACATTLGGVPAVSTWGLVVMVLLLGIAATVMIRRKPARVV